MPLIEKPNSIGSIDINWKRILRASVDCPTTEDFSDWMEKMYGLKMNLHLGHRTIVDEKKYLIYLLKYGK